MPAERNKRSAPTIHPYKRDVNTSRPVSTLTDLDVLPGDKEGAKGKEFKPLPPRSAEEVKWHDSLILQIDVETFHWPDDTMVRSPSIQMRH